ncbi:MAG: aldo/keto reductase [Thermomicrobiales bacterium]
MKYGTLSSVDKPVARVVQGTTVLDPADPAASFALLDAIFELGGTTFDTAQSYLRGDAERLLGRWMAERRNQDQVLVITRDATIRLTDNV